MIYIWNVCLVSITLMRLIIEIVRFERALSSFLRIFFNEMGVGLIKMLRCIERSLRKERKMKYCDNIIIYLRLGKWINEN